MSCMLYDFTESHAGVKMMRKDQGSQGLVLGRVFTYKGATQRSSVASRHPVSRY